jgi:hypothetical protein
VKAAVVAAVAIAVVVGALVTLGNSGPRNERLSVESGSTAGIPDHYEVTVTFADGSTAFGAVKCGDPVQSAGYLTTGHGPAAFNACTSYFSSQVASYYLGSDGRHVCDDLVAEAKKIKYHGDAESPPMRATLTGVHFGEKFTRHINTISGTECDAALAKVFLPLLAPTNDADDAIVQPWPPGAS